MQQVSPGAVVRMTKFGGQGKSVGGSGGTGSHLSVQVTFPYSQWQDFEHPVKSVGILSKFWKVCPW